MVAAKPAPAGQVVNPLPANSPSTTTRQSAPGRTIVFHYHLFKNAGTTIDTILQNSFPGCWVTREFVGPPAKTYPAVQAWVRECVDALCFSSHTARMPLPSAPGLRVFPVLFLRHPVDRVRSAYEFERRQQGEKFGSVLARNTTFRGYVETRLALQHERQCRNFQTLRLADMFPPTSGTELARATKALKELPFVGLVEKFAQSMGSLDAKLREHGFGPLALQDAMAQNTSAGSPRPLENSLQAIRADLGSELFGKLEEANADDLAIYRIVRDHYEVVQDKRLGSL